MILADRRAKIVATIGPASSSEKVLEELIRAGMNVARLNFSHGSHDDHRQVIERIRRISNQLHAPVTILQDLQGPKIRVGKFEGGAIELEDGEVLVVTMRDVVGRKGLIPSDFKALSQSVKPGTKILIDDGLIELRVLEVFDATEIRCEVIYGGLLKDRKGINCPGVSLAADCLTPKDLADLEFGLQNQVDYVALSFVRSPEDIVKLRELIELRKSEARIVAKIEMLEAVDCLEEIIRVTDVVMVARGDLAVEIGQTRLPQVQKHIIRLANQMNKPVITATQMLDSMVENPRPTRAEITDVANAILDGSDALMLSAESASGRFPALCVRTMHDIIHEVENNNEDYYRINLESEFLTVAGSIGASASLSALKLDAKVVVCLTTSGKTANIISGYRPKARLVAVTDDVTVLNKLELVWGLQTLVIPSYQSMAEVLQFVEKVLIEYGLAKTGDRIVMTLGQPIAQGSKTNSLHLFTLGGEMIERLPEEKLPLRCQRVTFLRA